MENLYNEKMGMLGYGQLVCDIFLDWENVKDELLVPDRKNGTGNGTIHVFLGAANPELKTEFKTYYDEVEKGEDPSKGAISIKHFFLKSNIISMVGYLCQYYYKNNSNSYFDINLLFSALDQTENNNGLLYTNSLLKLSTGSNKLRPYFKQFESDGVFSKIIRKVLLPNSAYKIALYKNTNNEYAAFWLIGADSLSNFETNCSTSYLRPKGVDSNVICPLQQIIYGAPGTGKSHQIKEDIANSPHFRTTFHPDSDYSSFVGAYKPTMTRVDVRDVTGKVIIEDGKKVKEDKIVYKYVAQAFLEAYIAAWKSYPQKQYLIIEEINRGNCAQIFGDLFQLLDRNGGGFSDYPIRADSDIRQYIYSQLSDCELSESDKKRINTIYTQEYENVIEKVINGEVLLLPSNLSIWATMNTSDQSLFPIDSAFKRRWDWTYIPISNANKDWKISANGYKYDWWSFLEKINDKIGSTTDSEDKKLGYFFVKAEDECSISADKFVGKVIFYLWNDVFKDYGFDDAIFKDEDDDGILTFQKFFKSNGKANEKKVQMFLNNLGVEKIDINSILYEDNGYNGDNNNEVDSSNSEG